MQKYLDTGVYMHKSGLSQFVKSINCSVQFWALIHDMLLVFYI